MERTVVDAESCTVGVITFSNCSARSGELSAAQRRLWSLLERFEVSGVYNLSLSVQVDPSTDQEAVVRAVSRLLEEHETLRTVFHRHDDGEVSQQVLDAGQIPFFVRSIDSLVRTHSRTRPSADSDSLESIERPFKEHVFDLKAGIPMLACLMQNQTGASKILFVFSHLLVDRHSLRPLRDWLVGALDGTASLRNVFPPLHPLDKRKLETSEQGRRHSKLARAYLAEQLKIAPHGVLPPRRAEDPTHWCLSLFTHYGFECMETARASGPGVPSALGLSACAYALSEIVGHQTVPIWCVFSGRAVDTRRTIGMYTTETLICAPVRDSVADMVAEFRTKLIRGASRSALEYQDVEEELRRSARSKLNDIALTTVFNFQEKAERLVGLPPEQASVQVWKSKWSGNSHVIALNVDLHPNVLAVSIACDTAYVSPTQISVIANRIDAFFLKCLSAYPLQV